MAFLDETGATILADEVKTYVGNTAVAKETGKGLSTNDYTTTEKNKLDGIAEGANKTIVDSVLNASSENPVQNKVIYTEFEKKLNTDGDSKDLTNTFVAQDSTNVTQWTDVDVLTSAEKHSSIFNKISTMFKNVRYLYKMLGTADISTLGEGANIGTVTGALSKLNSDNTYGRKVYNSGTLLDILEQELDNMNKHTDWGFVVTNEVSDLKNYFPEIDGWYVFNIKTQANETICKVYDSWAIYRSYEFVYFKSTREISQMYYSGKPRTTKVNIILNDVEWIQSSQGMFYAYIETDIQNIISVNVRDLYNLRTTDNIHVGFKDSSILLMSNTNTFTDSDSGKNAFDINVVYL